MKDLEFTQNEKLEFIYDGAAGIMAIIAVLVVMMEFSTAFTKKEMKLINMADNAIYIIFVLDYLIRLILSKDKKKFLKYNIIDLIAILPLAYLSFSRWGSALKLIRVLSYILRLIGNVQEILFTNGFIYALGLTVIITVIGSIGIYIFEVNVNEGILSYEDALWWSIVTVTTVGYGDIIVITRAGRIVAAILMITGVGFIGMLTSTMATFFFSQLEKRRRDYLEIKKEDMKKNDTIDISDLSEEEKESIIRYYNFLKYNKNK